MIDRAPRNAPTESSNVQAGSFSTCDERNFVCLSNQISYRPSITDSVDVQIAGRNLKWLGPDLTASIRFAGGFVVKQRCLSEFIHENTEAILQAWEAFAHTFEPQAGPVCVGELRPHARRLLVALAKVLDISRPESGLNPKFEEEPELGHMESAAEMHAEARFHSGYTVLHLLAEYRALRSSVLTLWSRAPRRASATALADMARFNNAVDQALGVSVARYQRLADQSQNMFLAILGHDLRNPLGALVAGANLMLNDLDLSRKHVMLANRMFNSAKRMRKLIDDLIDFTRTHLGAGIPVRLATGNLIAVCHQVFNELRTVHPKRFVDLRTPPKLDAYFDGDRMAQVLSNLIGNALQYGSEIYPVRVFVSAGDDTIEIKVNNRGSIIPPDRIIGIFDAMVRLAADAGGDNIERTSLGIGLYISREIIKAHGGEISVESNEENGTTFRVTMPRHTICPTC